MAKYTKYTHLNPQIDTISGLVDNKSFKGYGISVGRFVSIADAKGITNLERIIQIIKV